MEDFMEHLKCYKAAVHSSEEEGQGQEKLISTSKVRMIEEAFFDEEDSENPWRAVCCDQQARLSQ